MRDQPQVGIEGLNSKLEKSINIIDQMLINIILSNHIQDEKFHKYREEILYLYEFIDNSVNNNSTTHITTVDKSFIADFKKYAKKYPRLSGSLISLINSNPEIDIKLAKGICTARKSGFFENFKKSGLKTIARMKNPMTREVIKTSYTIKLVLAPKYYCPEFSRAIYPT